MQLNVAQYLLVFNGQIKSFYDKNGELI